MRKTTIFLASMVILALAYVVLAATPVQSVTVKSGWTHFGTASAIDDATGLTGAESQYANLLANYADSWIIVGEDKAVQHIRFRGSAITAAATLEIWQSSGDGDGEYLADVTLTAPGSGAQEATGGGYYFDQITVTAATSISIIVVNGDNNNKMGYIKVDTEAGSKIIIIIKTLTGTIYWDSRGYQ